MMVSRSCAILALFPAIAGCEVQIGDPRQPSHVSYSAGHIGSANLFDVRVPNPPPDFGQILRQHQASTNEMINLGKQSVQNEDYKLAISYYDRASNSMRSCLGDNQLPASLKGFCQGYPNVAEIENVIEPDIRRKLQKQEQDASARAARDQELQRQRDLAKQQEVDKQFLKDLQNAGERK
jgi:hypothetical protein